MPNKPFFSALNHSDVEYHPAGATTPISSNPIVSVLGVGALALTGVGALCTLPYLAGIPLALAMSHVGAEYFSYRQQMQRKQLFLSNARKRQIKPPSSKHPMLKKRTLCTFNHVFSFIKDQGYFWYALREKDENEKPHWQLFYIDGLNMTPAQFAASEMIADGQNFMLRVPGEKSDTIYYKKIISETRKNNRYIISNLCEEPDAIDSWFTLPIIRLLKPSQWGMRLTLGKKAKWAMSNAAEYKNTVVDDRGIHHRNIPITTVYEYCDSKVSLHDPFVEKGSTYHVAFPALNQDAHIEASASFVFTTSQANIDSQTYPIINSRYLDYDSEGLNPLISFTFDNQNKHKRLLPMNKITSHLLPATVKDITNLTVLQCYHPPHTLEIRVNSDESEAFFFKKMEDSDWQHYNLRTGKTSTTNTLQATLPKKEASPIYQSTSTFLLNGKPITKVTVLDFNLYGTFADVIMEEGTQTHHFILRRHQNFIKSFINRDSLYWTLNPSPWHPETDFLKRDESVPVHVQIQGNSLRLRSNSADYSFDFTCLKSPLTPVKPLLFSRQERFPKAPPAVNTPTRQRERYCQPG